MEGILWRDTASPWQVREELDAADDRTHPTRSPQARARESREMEATITRRAEPLAGHRRAVACEHSGSRDFLQRLSREQPPVLKSQDWEAQFTNKQRLLLNSMKKTVRRKRKRPSRRQS